MAQKQKKMANAMIEAVDIAKQNILLWSFGIFLAGVFTGVLVNGALKASSGFWFWYLWAVISTAGLLWFVTFIWDKVPGISASPVAERNGISLVCTLGTIGGYVRWMHKFFESPDKHVLGLDPLLWPLEGAALSLVVVLVLRGGVVNSSSVEQSKAVNWLGLYAVAALTGLCANEAVQRLAEVFSALLGKK